MNLIKNCFSYCLGNNFVDDIEYCSKDDFDHLSNIVIEDLFELVFETHFKNDFVFDDYVYSSGKSHVKHFELIECFSKVIFVYFFLED